MALLKLQDIGKIYVSETTVSVGIRNVNLEFDTGEFVAVTGKSGSGKTTLLNVISGMDSYEEGELFIDGRPTSHYTQEDWETYRQDYVSFIFQDYNIIESFTVQQNVELALMHIPNAKERHARAMELIDRVGLTPFRRHKGSKLSGGQKQRTVIARALAKDSPIILADEPTGNLDSKTSQEIIALLQEISREKLVIVVTHSFDQLADCATREIRIFDGTVERDERLQSTNDAPPAPPTSTARENVTKAMVRKAFSLGAHRFFAMPKLSFFLCLVMLLTMVGSFLATSSMFTDLPIGKPLYVFQNVEGRVVVVRHDGEAMSERELESLQAQTGAQSYLHYDAPLDRTYSLRYYDPETQYFTHFTELRYDYGGSYTPDAGRLPIYDNEVFLYLPISWQPIYGKGELKKTTVTPEGLPEQTVCGVAYFYDNTKEAKAVFTTAGYQRISRVMFFADAKSNGGFKTDLNLLISFANQESGLITQSTQFGTNFWQLEVDPTLKTNEVYFQAYDYNILKDLIDRALKNDTSLRLESPIIATVTATMSGNDYYDGKWEQQLSFPYQTLRYDLCHGVPEREDFVYMGVTSFMSSDESCLYVSQERMDAIMDYYYSTYTQASLFFEDDDAAQASVATLRDLGYHAICADATYTYSEESFLGALLSIFSIGMWFGIMALLVVVFVLCTGRAMRKTKGDLGIMRSMGIPMKIIRLSTYVQMLYAMVPAYLLTVVTAIVLYLIPKTNGLFPFMHFFQYLMLTLGALLLCVLMARRHNMKMFSQSVRKTLKGGDAK